MAARTLTCRTALGKTLGSLGLALLMLFVCWLCTTLPKPAARIAGWAGLAFFGACLVPMLRQLLRVGPSVVLDGHGLHDLRSPLGPIPWADVVSLRIRTVRDQRFLCVEVRDPARYRARLRWHRRLLARANAGLALPPVTIGFVGLTPGLDEVWSYLREQHPDKIVTPPASGGKGDR